MKLENELTYDKGASLALAWAFVWRWTLLILLISIPMHFIKLSLGFVQYPWLIGVAEFIIMILLMWLVVHRVLNKGFSEIKIVVMEINHYDNLVKENQEKKSL